MGCSAVDLCCTGCFNDSWLKEYILRNATSEGNCTFCGTTQVQVLEADHLFSFFLNVTSFYSEPAGGSAERADFSVAAMSLMDFVQHDWKVFSDLLLKGRRDRCTRYISLWRQFQ